MSDGAVNPSDFVCYLPKWQFFYGPTGQQWRIGGVKTALCATARGLQLYVSDGRIPSATSQSEMKARMKQWECVMEMRARQADDSPARD